jgi:hypothetical protein
LTWRATDCTLPKRAEAMEVQILPEGQYPNGYDSSQRAFVTA